MPWINTKNYICKIYFMQHNLAKILILIGILLTISGVIYYFFGDKLNWIGRLPGDIRIEKENFKFYFPITTMIIVSILLSIIVKIFQKLF